MEGLNMSTINNVTAAYAASTSYTSKTTVKKDNTEVSTETAYKEDVAAVYEKSSASAGNQKVDNQALIQRMKADAEQRTSQLRSLVEQMMQKQGVAIGKADDMWSFLASGDFTVTPEVKAQAQADIAEDGYWGVNQTSDRIIQFATALTGGDPDKIESMREAFKKGYAQAEKTWGGSLPEISQKTYDAVMEKFDKLAADAGLTTEA